MRRLSILVLLLAGLPARAEEAVDYDRQIKPLLKHSCYACHGALKQEGNLRLDTAAAALKGGDSGPAIAAGKPDASGLIERVTATDESLRMPQEGRPLTSEEIALLKAWIAAGAQAPTGEQAEADPRSHWAFQPPVRPALPLYAAGNVLSQPIDQLLDVERLKRGLSAAGPASKHVLLRRVYLDLVGLPPSREELQAFLADERPDAYERVVDRLLASPQHGERWARHWMDVWRYSDWYGRRSVPDVMNSYPHVWRWRDWITKSLNADKGYDQVVQEMLAADELWPDDQERVVATGFIVRNWFKWNYDTWMRDQVEHTGKAFLGLTFNCALCHDHKYDPISQEDYFRFRAIFEPLELRHDRVAGLADPGPFKKYVYAQSYGPIPHGLVRVFDEKLDAPTRIYRAGDQRLIVEDKPAMPPGVPSALGAERFQVQPISLPASAAYPGLRPFVQEEEKAKRQADVVAAEAALAAATDDAAKAVAAVKLAAAKAELASIEARIAADNAKYGVSSGDATSLATAASQAERQAKLAASQAAVAADEQTLAAAESLPVDDKKAAAVKAAQDKLAAAKSALTAAEAEASKADGTYAPLSAAYPQQSTGRRAALARWIVDRQNPLTARVAVNHLWRWHMGRPLVETVANFGRSGKPPSHPELLDWLAVELMDGNWSLKRMHRQMVTSDAYRMASQMTNDQGARTNDSDPDNAYYWRANVSRMEAEVLRDSLLYVAGQLDLTIGGQEIDHAAGLTSRRRSLYFAHHGESKMEFLELFDGASPVDCYERTASIRPQQALAMANNELALEMSREIAALLALGIPAPSPPATLPPGERGDIGDEAFAAAAFEQVLSRPATGAEIAAATRFLAQQQALYKEANAGGDIVLRSRASLCHALLNHHDFISVR
jgi:hypothetical protein